MKNPFAILLLTASLCYGQGQLPDDVLRNLLMAGRAAASGVVADTGTPYAWWKMTGSDTNTTQLLDAQSNYNLFRVNTPTLVQTNATYTWYNFSSGSQQYMTGVLTAASSPFCSTSLSISAWVYLATNPDTTRNFGILNKYASGQYPISFRAKEGPTYSVVPFRNKACIFLGDNANSAYIGRATSSDILTTNWYHLAFVWDGGGTTNAIKMYVNGALNQGAGLAGGSFTGFEANTAPVILANDDGAVNFMNGLIDDVRYFTNALTATQIQNLYNGRNQP